jgi:hypothetical protein
MRDQKRIPRILDKLRKIWNDSPDWRLGQLLNNLGTGSRDPFFIEDDWWEAALDAEITRRKLQ